MVNPAGTGRPILVISARPAPLPPRSSRQVPSPSALPAPKKYTHFFTVRLACLFGVVERLLLSRFRSGGRENCRLADFKIIQVILEITSAALHRQFLGLHFCSRAANRSVQFALRGVLEEIGTHLVSIAWSNVGLFKDFANALKGNRQRLEVL